MTLTLSHHTAMPRLFAAGRWPLDAALPSTPLREYTVAFSSLRPAITLHHPSCERPHQARLICWTVEADSLTTAIAVVKRDEDAVARGLSVTACACVRSQA